MVPSVLKHRLDLIMLFGKCTLLSYETESTNTFSQRHMDWTEKEMVVSTDMSQWKLCVLYMCDKYIEGKRARRSDSM